MATQDEERLLSSDVGKTSEEPLQPRRRLPHIFGIDVVRLGSEILLAFTFSYLWSFIFENPTCAMFFQYIFQPPAHGHMHALDRSCGCTWPWAGGWSGCNYHNKTGPRCPWCSMPGILAYAPTMGAPAFMTVVIAALLFVPRLRPVAFLPVRIMIGIVAWFILMFVMALLARGDYPYFL